MTDKKDYFSQHTAELLKQYGYPQDSRLRYIEEIPGTEREEWNEEELRMETVKDVVTYAKGTLLEAQRWLREHRCVAAYAEPIKAKVAGLTFEYVPVVVESDGSRHKAAAYYEYYEEAIDHAIRCALKRYCPKPSIKEGGV